MFFEPMLRYLLIPAIFLLITFLYPLFGRFYRHFATKSLNKKVSNVKDLKKVRKSLQKEVNVGSSDSDLESELISVTELETKERLKATALRVSLAFNKFFVWVSRLTAIVLLSFGWTFTVATVGASAAVLYVAVMASVDCDPVSADNVSAQTSKTSETQTQTTTTSAGDTKDTTSTTQSSTLSNTSKSSESNSYGFGEVTSEVTEWSKKYSGFTFVGDSLGVGVEPKLKVNFPNSVFDSKVSRAFENSDTTLSGIETVKKLESEKKVKEVLVVALGTNQVPTTDLMDKLVGEAKSAKTIIWVTTASEGGSGSYNKVEHDKIADVIKSYVAGKSNMAYLDWNAYVKEKSKWSDLTSDSVHMNDKGYDLYSKFLTRGLYDVLNGGSKDDLVTKAVKKVKCKPKKKVQATSSSKETSSLSSLDGQDNPPSDAFTSWAYRPEDLPEGLKPYIIDPKNYGMDFGTPGSGWFQTSDPELNGQCVALTISLGNHVWGRPQESVQGNGIDQANAWASIFGNSVTTTPRRGAIFSSKEHPTYGHTGIVCTVFKDGSILTCEQNLPLAGWNYRGEQYVWCFRIYRQEQWKSLGMTFAYDEGKTPNLK